MSHTAPKTLSDYRKDIDSALEDSFLRRTLDTFAVAYRANREAVFKEVDERGLIKQIADAKDDACKHMEELYEQFRRVAEERGVHVHRAATAEDANRIIASIARENNVKRVIKSKSMTAEEIQLNPYLEKEGFIVDETDLGEWIIQLRHEGPSHMVMPAIHLSRYQVADDFTKETGELDFSAELMHGTHVAGTIAAVNNNGVGVCGIAGGSGRGDGVKIMSCEILGKSESGSSGAGLAGQIRAIKYAADNGAVICQNSWGYTAGTISVTDWTRGSYSALSRAMEYFNKYAGLDENGNQTGPMAGGIVLFAAGNDASSEVCYPAADANAISVGATAFTGAPAYYTNYGTWVRISAPGGDQMLSNAYGGVYSTSVAADGSSGYEGSQGTSMACPHVSGACALAVSYYYGAEKRKGLTGEMLRQALLSSTQSVDRYCTGKYQQYLGNMGIGSLDTYKLLRNIAKIDGIPAQRVGVGDTVSIDLSNHFTATNVLGYTVSVPDLVKIELRGGVMKLTGLKKGRTTIIVSDGAAIRKPIEVTVE